MKYPDYSHKNYGTIHPICRAFYLMELTNDRIATLKQWIIGTDEIDICNGYVKIIEGIGPKHMKKALIEKDSTIFLFADMKRDHRIYGYKKKDIYSTKMILFSIFTNDVENNPSDCKYGAYYDTNWMSDLGF